MCMRRGVAAQRWSARPTGTATTVDATAAATVDSGSGQSAFGRWLGHRRRNGSHCRQLARRGADDLSLFGRGQRRARRAGERARRVLRGGAAPFLRFDSARVLAGRPRATVRRTGLLRRAGRASRPTCQLSRARLCLLHETEGSITTGASARTRAKES
jgi:hypothetical protein